MVIKELNHKPELKIKDCIVELSYEEVRDIANGFYLLTRMLEEDIKKFEVSATELASFYERKKSFAILFDLVKHGQVEQFTIDNCASPVKATCPADCKGVVNQDE